MKQLLYDQNRQGKKIRGVATDQGVIRADCVINARGRNYFLSLL